MLQQIKVELMFIVGFVVMLAIQSSGASRDEVDAAMIDVAGDPALRDWVLSDW